MWRRGHCWQLNPNQELGFQVQLGVLRGLHIPEGVPPLRENDEKLGGTCATIQLLNPNQSI